MKKFLQAVKVLEEGSSFSSILDRQKLDNFKSSLKLENMYKTKHFVIKFETGPKSYEMAQFKKTLHAPADHKMTLNVSNVASDQVVLVKEL